MIAVILATINVVGGFLVTHRMLMMFREEEVIPRRAEATIVVENPLIKLAYVAAAVLFIFGLKMMGHPRTAVRGNLFGALAMLLAIVLTLVGRDSYWFIAIGLVIGTTVGTALRHDDSI